MGEFYQRLPKADAPCRDCPDRTMGCHPTCKAYIEWSQERQELIALREKEHELNTAIMKLNYNKRNYLKKRKHLRK